MINISGGNITKIERIGEKLKLINNIIDEVLAAKYKLKVKSWIYRITNLNCNINDDLSFKTSIAL